MKKEHAYAQLLRWIADGETIQWRGFDEGVWGNISASVALSSANHEVNTLHRYRIKPKTIRIGAFDVPEPMRVAPLVGTSYFVVSPAGTFQFNWSNLKTETINLEAGFLHATKEGAEAMRNALLSLTKAPT